MFLFFKFFLPLTLAILVASDTSFSAFRIQVEGYVKSIAQKIEDNNVYSPSNCDCIKQSFYDECVGVNHPICYENFPRHLECLGDGVVMAQTQTFRLSKQQNKYRLKCQQMSFMCQVKEKTNGTFDNINENRNFRYTTTYIGSSTGIFSSHPGTISNCDNPYDPRLRPWYVVGSTGARNIIMFFKIENQSNKNRILQIADYLVNTTKVNDDMMVVDLNKGCDQNEFCNISVKGTSYQQNLAYDYVKSVKISKKATNYTFMKTKTEDFFQNVKPSNKNVVVVVSDAIPSASNLESVLTTSSISEYSPIFFPIIVENEQSDLSQLQQLSCKYSGKLIHDSDPYKYYVEVMDDYTRYFSEGTNATLPLWSPIYLDAFGFGSMVTVVMPVYKIDEVLQKKLLIGVAGLDVTIDYLKLTYNLTQTQLQAQLLSPLEYQVRDDIVCNCSFCSNDLDNSTIINIEKEEKKQDTKFWRTGQTYEQTCCSITVDGFIGLMVTIFALIIIAIIVGCCYYKKRKENAPQYEVKGDLIMHSRANPVRDFERSRAEFP